MKTFVCLTCRTEKDVRHKAPDRPDHRPRCNTCHTLSSLDKGRTEGYYKRAQKRYRNGDVPPWAFS